MKQTLSILFAVVVLLAAGMVTADTAMDRYETLQKALQDVGANPDAVGPLVTGAIADTSDPVAVVVAAVEALMPLGNVASVKAAVNAALDAAESPEQALAIAAAALEAVDGDSRFAEAVRDAITEIALAHGVDPGALLAATAANPQTGHSRGPKGFGESANGAPGSGSGGGVGSPG